MSTQTVERPSESPKRARGVPFWVGIVLIVAGLGVLAYVAWQFYGTNIVAHQKQQNIVEQTQKVWRSEAGAGATGSAKGVELNGAEALIRIPKLGRSYVVPVLEGTSPEVLAKGFGHFTRSADPGEVGNYALAAHRVTHGEPLRHLPELRPGDEVIVETIDTTFTYRLDTDPRKLVIPFTGTWVLDPVPKNPEAGGPQPAQKKGQRLITLTTCSEIFHTDNRMIAFGHLVGAEPKPAG